MTLDRDMSRGFSDVIFRGHKLAYELPASANLFLKFVHRLAECSNLYVS